MTRRIMPIGLLSRRLGDSFGNSVYLAESIDDTFGTLAWAADENLLDGISAYDDDISPWTADNRGRVVDQQDQLLLREMQDFLEENSLVLSSFGCDLTRDAMFRNGALTNPDDTIRQLAMRKIERAAFIAKALGTRNFRLFIGREGYEEPLGVKWKTAFSTLAEGLNGVTRFINARSGFESIELMTGYSRRLRGHLYMGSPMQAAFMMSQLNQPGFWRLCIENDDLSYMPAYSVLAATNSLAYMPFGGEDAWNWNAHIANMVSIIKMLGEFSWSGNAECLFAPMRTEADDKERELSKRQFITNAMTAFTLANEQAKRLDDGWNTGLSPSDSGLMAVTLCNGIDADELLRLTVADRNGNDMQPSRRIKDTAAESTLDKDARRQDSAKGEVVQSASLQNGSASVSSEIPDAKSSMQDVNGAEQPKEISESPATVEMLLLGSIADPIELQEAMGEMEAPPVPQQSTVDAPEASSQTISENQSSAQEKLQSQTEEAPIQKSERFRKYRNRQRIKQESPANAPLEIKEAPAQPEQPVENEVRDAPAQPEQPVENKSENASAMPEGEIQSRTRPGYTANSRSAKGTRSTVRRRYSRFTRRK